MTEAEVGGPTQAASWTKLPGPLFRGLPAAHVWCAGVASPFASPDGEVTWFVYGGYGGYDYARELLGQPLKLPSGEQKQ